MTPKAVRLVDLVVIAAILMAACGHLLIKQGLNEAALASNVDITTRLLKYVLQPVIVTGLFVYASGTVLWIAAVSKLAISYVYPLTALNYVVVSIGGAWILGERIPIERWAGIFIVIVGVVLMQTSGSERSA